MGDSSFFEKLYNQQYASASQARLDLEYDFIHAAVAASCIGTVNATDIAAIVPPDMVSHPHNNAIWRATTRIAQNGTKPTLDRIWTYIHERMANSNLADGESWPEDIHPAIIGDCALSIFAKNEDSVFFYARKFREEALKTLATSRLLRLASESQQYGNPVSDIAQGLSLLTAELEGGTPEKGDLSLLMEKVVDSVENPSADKPLPTPWDNLNHILKGGFAKGELVILAARPGMGKTALASCLGVETARHGIQTLFISREVKDTTIGQRIVAREAKIDSAYFRQGLDHAKNILLPIRNAASVLASLPLHVVEKSIAPMTHSEVRRLVKCSRNCGLVIVDYLQLLSPEKQEYSREREIAEMSRAFKQLALDCNCPVVLLSQLNRQVEEGNREPRLSDLRESGAIEQDADIVIFLHARKNDVGLSDMPVKAIVAKGRSSGTGSANLIFKKPYADFVVDRREGSMFEQQQPHNDL